MEQQKDTIEIKKHSLLFRAVRVLFFCLLGLVLILALVVVGVSLYFSPSRIEKTVKPIVAEAIQGDFDFSIAHFNLLNGFVFKDIRLAAADSTPLAIPLRLLTAREASLRYNLRRLFKRHLVIEEVLIDSPKIEIMMLLPSEAQAVAAADSEVTIPMLPVELNLKQFRLINAEITIEARDSLTANHLFLSEINLNLDELRLPRGDIFSGDSLLSGKVVVALDNSHFVFKQQAAADSLNCNGRLDALLDLTLQSLSDIRLSSSLCLREIGVRLNGQTMVDTHAQNMPLALTADARFDYPQQRALIDSLKILVQEVPWLAVSMSADSLMTRPFIAGQVTQSAIPIAQLLSLAKVLAPDVLLPSIYLHNSAAAITLDGTSFSGGLPDSTNGATLAWVFNLALKNLGVTVNRGESLLQNLNMNASAQGNLGYQTMTDLAVHFEIALDSLAATLPDAKVFSGRVGVNLDAELNEQMMPASAQLAVKVSNLLGADISANLDVSTPSDLQQLRGSGSISLTHFDLSQLPEAQAVGRLSAKMDIGLNSLDSIKTLISIETDSITTLQSGQLMTWAPLRLISNLRLSADLMRQSFKMHNMSLSANNFLTGSMTASAELPAAQSVTVNAQISTLSLDHAALFDWLPAAIKQPLEGVQITGKTQLTADVTGSIQPNDTTYTINARLNTMPTDLSFVLQNLFVKDIRLDSKVHLDSKTGGNFDFILSIDSTQVLAPAPMSFRNNRFGFRISSLPDFQTVSLDTGYLSLPDFRTFGHVKAKIENLLTEPSVNARLEFHQAAEDTLVFGKDVFFKGYNDISLALRADMNQAQVDLAAQVKDLSIFLPNNTHISRVNADISFSQDINLQNMTVAGSSAPIVQTPSDGLVDYFLYRNYYAGNLNKSRLHIRKVEVADYTVENIYVDAYLGNGRIEIPYFAVDVYGGNIGGQFIMAVGENDPLDVDYRLSAHFSGINSALLVPSAKASSRGIITAHAELKGKGLDVQKGIDLDGYFNISQIESRVADNLLRSLDPEGKDSGIRSTRVLINRGFKPRLFQFEIRHGFCYPAVYFDQPWYFPVRLSGGAFELSRIPIASLLKMNQTMPRSAK